MTDDVARLSEELERYQQANDWPKVVETIKQLVDLEPDPLRRAKWCDVAGKLCRDELLERDDALEYFDSALDSYFMNLDALSDAILPMALGPFQAIERLRTDYSEWKDLDRAYRKMIVRVRSSTRFDLLQAGLFDKLGELYRTRLDMDTSALAAFEQARLLDPTNAARTEGIDRDGFLDRPR